MAICPGEGAGLSGAGLGGAGGSNACDLAQAARGDTGIWPGIWQERSREHPLPTPMDLEQHLEQHLELCRLAPVSAGLVARWQDWPLSSFLHQEVQPAA